MSSLKRILFIRHAHRLDRFITEAYPSFSRTWTTDCLINNTYVPPSVEFPVNLPRRIPFEYYLDDTPLSTMGEMCSQLVGNRLAEIGLTIDMVYSSPSLRCIQTSSRVLQGYSDLSNDQDVKIRVDGGLYEFGSFTSAVPRFLDPTFVSERGIPIDLSYKNPLTNDELLHLSYETYTDFKNRAKKCIDRIINIPGQDVESIVICTHAPTLLTFVRELLNKPITEDNLPHFSAEGNVMNKPAYLATVLMERDQNKKWVVASPQPLPSFYIRAHTTFTQSWLDKTSYESPVI